MSEIPKEIDANIMISCNEERMVTRQIRYVRGDIADDLLEAIRQIYPHLETSPEGERATKIALDAITKAEERK